MTEITNGTSNALFEDEGRNDEPEQAPSPPSEMIISVQPLTGQDGRAQLPVSTVNWRSNQQGQFIPVHGLDFLIGTSSILIQQTIELEDLHATLESANRYTVRVPNGEALYYGSEVSSGSQRCMCGTGRAFVIYLHDNTRQEALQLHRRLAASSCCFPCRLQEMRVVLPSGDCIGRIQQRWSVLIPYYWVWDSNDEVIFSIQGPAMMNAKALMLAEFKILTADGTRELGSLIHQWDRQLVSFVTTIRFPETAVQPKHKALLLGAAFLMEYAHFLKMKYSCCLCQWCC